MPVEQALVFRFTRDVADNSDKIDPDNDLDWFSLTYGWALASGLTPEQAFEFATHIRYHTDLG